MRNDKKLGQVLGEGSMVRLANRAARSALDILVSGSFRFFSPSLSLFFPFLFVHDETIIRVNRVTRMMGQRRYERNRSELISYHHRVLSNLLRFSQSTRSDGTALSFLFFFFGGIARAIISGLFSVQRFV